LAQLQPLLQQWKTLDNRLEQLQVDLRSDEKTLHLLDTALQGGALSDQTASYVRDVAKLLSETTTVQVRYFLNCRQANRDNKQLDAPNWYRILIFN
jgi:hypothetical protein